MSDEPVYDVHVRTTSDLIKYIVGKIFVQYALAKFLECNRSGNQ